MPSSVYKLAICSVLLFSLNTFAAGATKQTVLENYTVIAHAIFEDSLITAKKLQQSIDNFIQHPSEKTHSAAKQAWLVARIPYQQSEVFRFGNTIVDDWEGQLNAWPLDEGLIDYVDSSYQGEMGNVGANINIIANAKLTLGDTQINAAHITPKLLVSLNELGGSEANVATGYHAIEFLLWGQDLNETGPGAGQRSYTDYVKGKECSNGHCERRASYLKAAAQLLVDDLTDMVQQWKPGQKNNYTAKLLTQDTTQGITKMLLGMGSLSLGELAGERMKVSLEANSTEDEHDCFSDNTHNSHYYNALGIQNIYLGQYQRVNGSVIKGTSLSDLVLTLDKSLDQQTKTALSQTDKRMQLLVSTAEHTKTPMKFDQMIAERNTQGEKIISEAIAALVTQTKQLEKVAKRLGINNLNPDTADHEF